MYIYIYIKLIVNIHVPIVTWTFTCFMATWRVYGPNQLSAMVSQATSIENPAFSGPQYEVLMDPVLDPLVSSGNQINQMPPDNWSSFSLQKWMASWVYTSCSNTSTCLGMCMARKNEGIAWGALLPRTGQVDFVEISTWHCFTSGKWIYPWSMLAL